MIIELSRNSGIFDLLEVSQKIMKQKYNLRGFKHYPFMGALNVMNFIDIS